MPRIDRIVVSCEHGGNRVPAPYRKLFARCNQLLASHRGYDAGALELARRMARSLECPLVTASVTRLLVDLNRSPTNPAVFSTITRRLSVDERVLILNRYHQPHRGRVEDILAEALLDRGRVLHVSVHSFTPALNGSPRTADIGLLYDPRRPGERRFAAAWKFALKSATSDLRIRCNYPYLGRSDGLTTHLRGRLDRRRYLGLELEVNQSWVARESARWRDFQMVLIESLRAVLHR